MHPRHTGRHLVVKPGERPSALTVERIVRMRTNVAPEPDVALLRMAVQFEPLGKIEAAFEWANQGGPLNDDMADTLTFFMWNFRRESRGGAR